MTRKDFELIARTIKQQPENIRRAIAESFAVALQGTNANFDRAKFLKACGVTP